MRAHVLITSLVLLAACAIPEGPAEPQRGADVPPGRRPPPMSPFSSDTALLADRVAEAIERYDRDRWERFVDAFDPGELAADLRTSQRAIDSNELSTDFIFLMGDELFEHDFGANEGFGAEGRTSRIHDGRRGGPDALSCAECHHRGGFDGSGDLSQNAFFDGNGTDAATAFERNPPHTLGLGLLQRIAEEMTVDLRAQRRIALDNAKAARRPETVSLIAKGVSFGRLTAHPDGMLDTTKLEGIDPDLVVKPFGWKGSVATLREFVIDGFQRHHGMQLSADAAVGSGPTYDRDKDSRFSELTDGMVTSVVTYLALLDMPVMIPPRDPRLAVRHEEGMATFERIGCADCHRPAFGINDPMLKISDMRAVNVVVDGEAPRPRRDVFFDQGLGGGIPVYAYTDLKRHAMGDALSEGRPTVNGIPGDQFLTRPLWGVADTGPWLHDGRAFTLEEAILLHGGEGQRSRDAFAALPKSQQTNVLLFLTSLTRIPRLEYR